MIRRALPWWIATGILTIAYVVVWYVVVQMHRNVPAGLLFAVGYVAVGWWLVGRANQALRHARVEND